MIDAPSTPKSGEGFWLWFYKIVAGLLILVILVVHLLVNHFLAESGLLSWTEVVKYYQNPLILIMEIAFLISVVSHSLLGLRSIVLDLKPSRAVLGVVNWVFTLGGVAAVIYGIFLVAGNLLIAALFHILIVARAAKAALPPFFFAGAGALTSSGAAT